MRPLQRRRIDDGIADEIETPVVIKGFVGRSGLEHHLQALVETRLALIDRDAERLELFRKQTSAQADFDASLGQVIDCRQVLR